MKSIRVLSVASEIYPIIKTGGLADVAGALPIALAAEGIEVHTLVPGYPAVMAALGSAEQMLEWPLFFGGRTRLLKGSSGELDLFVLDAPHLFGRPGNPYLTPDGVDWPDNGLRFAALRAWRRMSRWEPYRPSSLTSCMRMTGRQVSRRHICSTAAARDRLP